MDKEKLLSISIIMISILILIILMLIYGNLQEITDVQSKIVEVSYIALFVSIYCIITSLREKIKWYNLFFLYLIFFVVFLFGQVFNRYLINFIDKDLYDLTREIDARNIAQAIIISTYCLLGMHIGGLLANIIHKKKINMKEKNIEIDEKRQNSSMRILGIILIAISIVFALSSLWKDFTLVIRGGYSSVYSDFTVGIDSWKDRLIPFFYIGLLILMVSYKDNIKIARCIFLINMFYSGMQIFLGARGLPILSVLMIVITWHICVKKVKKKTAIIIIISIIPVATLISMIREVRSYPMSQWLGNMDKIIVDTIKENPISTAINEMGTAIYPTAATISIFPDNRDYKYGSTYWYGIKGIIPNLGSELSKAKVYGDIQEEVSQYYGLSFGGSVIEDLYANFGMYAILFMIAIGFGMNKLQIKMEYENSRNKIIYPLYATMCIQIIWTVRNNINPIFRYFVWYIITTYLLYKILYTSIGKKSREDVKNNEPENGYNYNSNV